MILCAVMIAKNRSHPIGIPDKNRTKNQADIHYQPVNDNSVLAGIFKELYIVEDADKGAGGFCHKFRGPVRTAFNECPAVPYRAHKLKETVVSPSKINKRKYATHDLGQGRGCCSPRKSPLKADDKKRVQKNIAKSRAYRDRKPQPRLFGSHKEKLELIYQYPCGKRQNKYPSVQYAACKEPAFGTEQGRYLRHEDKPRYHHQNTKCRGCQYDQGKQAVRPSVILFTKSLCDKRAAAHTEHITNRSQDIKYRHNQIDRGKLRLSHKISDKISVHNYVEGSKYIHHNGRQRKPQ